MKYNYTIFAEGNYEEEEIVAKLEQAGFTKVFVENSSLNMDRITEHCEVLYTFVTALDALKIINVNEEYVLNMLNDLRK